MNNTPKLLFALAICCVLALSTSAISSTHTTSGFTSPLIYSLPSFQNPVTGGFRAEGQQVETLETTYRAIFLANLLGLQSKINSASAIRFIQSLENTDSGYSQRHGVGSDLESVRQALLSYKLLGASVPNAQNVANYVQSLSTSDNLFANRVGEKGNVQSTALAFEVFEILNLQQNFRKGITPNVLKYLKSHVKETADKYFAFPEEQGLSPISANYYGILLGSYVGFDFGDSGKWVAFIASQQSDTGGFFADSGKTKVTLEVTANAISSLHLLQQTNPNTKFEKSINVEAVVSYAANQAQGRNIRNVALAHLIAALARPTALFKTTVSYESLEPIAVVENRIISGSHIKPVLSVRTVDGHNVHAGFDVELQSHLKLEAKLSN